LTVQIVWAVLAVVLAGVGLLSQANGQENGPASAPLFLIGSLAAMALIVSIIRTRVVLTAAAVETYGLFGMKRMERADIVGYRRIRPSRAPAYLELQSRNPSAPVLRLDASVLTDRRTQPWFAGVQDLEARDKAEAQAAIDQDARLGATVQQRRKTASRLKVLYGALAVVGVGFLFARLFDDRAAPWFFIALAIYLAVFLGLALLGPVIQLPLSRGRAGTFTGLQGRVGLLAVLLLPGLGSLAMLEGIHLASGQAQLTLVAGALAPAAVIVLAAGRGAGPFRDPGSALLACAACALCFYGLADGVNAVADPSAPRLDYGQVSNLRAYHGKSTTYYVELTYANGTAAEETISRSLYDQLHVGERACIATRPGALRLAWYDVEVC
jgi:hypothetical protein